MKVLTMAFNVLKQKSTNCSSLVKSGPPPSLSIKFYWHIDTPIHLHITCGCFRDTSRYCLATKLNIKLALYRGNLLTLAQKDLASASPQTSPPLTPCYVLQPHWTSYCSPNGPAHSHSGSLHLLPCRLEDPSLTF